MKYLAVIFDLFGTLAGNFSLQGYNDALGQMASALSLPSDDFRQVWFTTSKGRSTVPSQSCETDVEYICRELGALPDKSQIQLAAKSRLDYIRQVMMPQTDAIETLLSLKEAGYKIALLSNCSHEIPVVWTETSFAPLVDVTIFSCSVGMRKPDPGIYQLTTERLGVRPGECIFVGDGGSEELSGALNVGMYPVLIRPDGDSTEPHLMKREQWNGPTISSLKDALVLLRDGGGSGTT